MSIDFRVARPFSRWRLKPQPGEPSYGYFARLVVDEGHDSLSVYANEIGLDGRNIDPAAMLEAICRLPLDEPHKSCLRASTPVLEDGFWRLGNEVVRLRQLSFEQRRSCPKCLAAGPYHRVWWDLVDLRFCEIHGTPLVTLGGSRRLNWSWPFFDFLPDGEKIARDIEPSIGDLEMPRLDFHRLASARLETRQREDGPFSEFELFDIIQSANFLSRWLQSTVPGRMLPPGMANIEFGFAMLQLEPNDLIARFRQWFLDVVPETTRRIGFHASAKSVAGYWNMRTDSRARPLIEEAMRQGFASVGKLGRKNTRFKSIEREEKTLLEAARALQVPPKGLSKLAKHLGILTDAKWNGDALSFDAEAFERLKSAVADLIPSTETRSITGLPGHEFRQLAKAGVITEFFGLPVAGRKGPRVLSRDVLTLVNTVTSAVDRAPKPGMITLFTYAKRNNIAQGEVAARLVRGDLTAAAIDPLRTGFRGFYFEDEAKQRSLPTPVMSPADFLEIAAGREALWRGFREALLVACPQFVVAENLPVGGSIFTSTRKLALQVSSEDEQLFRLTLDLHPARSARRWHVYLAKTEVIQRLSEAGNWSGNDTSGQTVTFDIRTPRQAVEVALVLSRLKPHFH